jgi:tetratricopeptide (TPR) repeat protein
MKAQLSPEELSHLSRLLDVALELEEDERERWIAGLEGEDAALAPLLARLLDPAAAGDGFLTRLPTWALGPAEEDDAQPLGGPRLGGRVGPYTLEKALGRGGMGSVFLAARSDGAYRGQVALKLPHPHLMLGQSRARFRRERDILAALQHPNIARFLDAGIADGDDLPAGGQPYLALEWVEGLPITDACRERRLPLEGRLALAAQVADAVHYAHGRLVVHRDIKPSNVLVAADGRVRLLDFGIAKLLAEDDPSGSGTQLTGAGESVATPDYAAPEQLLLGPITVATDVYAIGILLFELLTGRRPPSLTARPGFPRLGPDDAAPLASRSLQPGHAATVGGMDEKSLARALTGDLDAILAKALAIDPAERYPSAEALAADLERYGRSEPILARRIGRLALAGKFVRRHRLGVVLGGALALTIAVGVAGVLWQSAQTAREARRAAATRDFLIRVFQGGDPRREQQRPRGETTARQLVDLAAARIDLDLRDDPETRFELLDLTSTIYLYLDEIAPARKMVRLEVEAAEALFPPDDPRLLDAILFEIWTDLQAGDGEATGRHLRQLDERLRRHGLGSSRHRAEYFLAAGDLAQLEGNLAGRENALRQAVEIFAVSAPEESGYPATLANLGDLAYNRGQLEPALDNFERALEASRARPEAVLEKARLQSGRGRILLELGRLADARKALEAARQGFAHTLGADHLTAWRATAGLGRIACLGGDMAAAQELFAAIPPEHPDDGPGNRERRAEAEIQRGLCLAGIPGREEEAAAVLARAAATLAGKSEHAGDLGRAEEALTRLYRRPKGASLPASQPAAPASGRP